MAYSHRVSNLVNHCFTTKHLFEVEVLCILKERIVEIDTHLVSLVLILSTPQPPFRHRHHADFTPTSSSLPPTINPRLSGPIDFTRRRTPKFFFPVISSHLIHFACNLTPNLCSSEPSGRALPAYYDLQHPHGRLYLSSPPITAEQWPQQWASASTARPSSSRAQAQASAKRRRSSSRGHRPRTLSSS